jgi:hypothetical protein
MPPKMRDKTPKLNRERIRTPISIASKHSVLATSIQREGNHLGKVPQKGGEGSKRDSITALRRKSPEEPK